MPEAGADFSPFLCALFRLLYGTMILEKTHWFLRAAKIANFRE
jgi:hypothetical protein